MAVTGRQHYAECWQPQARQPEECRHPPGCHTPGPSGVGGGGGPKSSTDWHLGFEKIAIAAEVLYFWGRWVFESESCRVVFSAWPGRCRVRCSETRKASSWVYFGFHCRCTPFITKENPTPPPLSCRRFRSVLNRRIGVLGSAGLRGPGLRKLPDQSWKCKESISCEVRRGAIHP